MTTSQQTTVHLQGIGRVPAKPASELRIGDRIAYNYGSFAFVTKVEPCGEKSVKVQTYYPRNGMNYVNRYLSTRLVPLAR